MAELLVVVDLPLNTRVLLGPFRVKLLEWWKNSLQCWQRRRAECTITVDGKRGGTVESAGARGAIGTNYWWMEDLC